MADVDGEVLGAPRITVKGDEIDLTPPWRRATLKDLVREHSGVDIDGYPDRDALRAKMKEMNVGVDPAAGRGKLIDELMSTFV